MAAKNFSEIANAVNNINASFQDINTTDILTESIRQTNDSTNGWIGILIFAIMAGSVMLHVWKNRQDFRAFDEFDTVFIGLSIVLDVGIYLLAYSILQSYQIYIFIFTVYFVMAGASLLRKELLTRET